MSILHINIYIYIYILLSIHLTITYTPLLVNKKLKGGLLKKEASWTQQLLKHSCMLATIYKTLLKQMRLRQAKVLQKETPSYSCQTGVATVPIYLHHFKK